MTSWVLVSLLIKVNSGGGGESFDEAGAVFSPASSRIFSFFFKRSRSVILRDRVDGVDKVSACSF